MNIPELKINQFAVLMADGATGIVLNSDSKISHNKNDKVFLIFESIEEAKSYTTQVSKKDNAIEFCIYNHKKEVVEFIEAARHNAS